MRSQFTLWPQVHPRHDRPGVVSGPLLKLRPYRQLPWPGEEREGAWLFGLSLPRVIAGFHNRKGFAFFAIF
jgi:hypothetical protein